MRWKGSRSRWGYSPKHCPSIEGHLVENGYSSLLHIEFTSGRVDEEGECLLMLVRHIINDVKHCAMCYKIST